MSTKTKTEIAHALRNDLITFIDELIEFVPGDSNLMIMRGFAEIVIIGDVADYIYKNLVPIEDKVINREEDYFMENAVMFERLQNRASTVNHFKTLWKSTDDPDNKEVVWEWLHHFITLSKMYKAQ